MLKKILYISLLMIFPFAVEADVIFFKDGKKINVDEAWEEGDQIKCKRFGGIVSYSKSGVERIEKEERRVEEKKSAPIIPAPAPEPKRISRAKTLAEEAFYILEGGVHDGSAILTADEKLEEAYAINPDEPWIYLTESVIIMQETGRLYRGAGAESMSKNAVARAIKYANKAVNLDSKFSLGYSQLASLYIILGDYEKANQFIETAYKHDPGSFYVWLNKGNLALKKGDAHTALRLFEEAWRCSTRSYQKDLIKEKKRYIEELSAREEEEEEEKEEEEDDDDDDDDDDDNNNYHNDENEDYDDLNDDFNVI